MACMEHSCTVCDWHAGDNRRISQCPKCGARCTNHFDETSHEDYEEFHPPTSADGWEEEEMV